MSKRELTIEHNGSKYTGYVATVRSTQLGQEDHGILTMYTNLEWPGGGVSLGGFTLDAPQFEVPGDSTSKFLGRKPTAYGFDYVLRVMEIAGVSSYERIAGQRVLALFEYSDHGTLGASVVGIAHIDDESQVFIPKEHAEKWLAAVGE